MSCDFSDLFPALPSSAWKYPTTVNCHLVPHQAPCFRQQSTRSFSGHLVLFKPSAFCCYLGYLRFSLNLLSCWFIDLFSHVRGLHQLSRAPLHLVHPHNRDYVVHEQTWLARPSANWDIIRPRLFLPHGRFRELSELEMLPKFYHHLQYQRRNCCGWCWLTAIRPAWEALPIGIYRPVTLKTLRDYWQAASRTQGCDTPFHDITRFVCVAAFMCGNC